MPFTPAHPAIVLPFLRWNPRYVSASALVAGSMAPDFEYFLKMGVSSKMSHTFWGLLYFDIPVTVFLLLVFHGIVKHNLIHNLPVPLQEKFQHLLRVDFIQYFKDHIPAVLIGALAGSALHIFWDSFTHSSGYFAQRIPLLKTTYIQVNDLRFPLSVALQHLSTVIGLIAIAVYIRYMKPESFTVNKPSVVYWLMLGGITTGIVWLRFLIKSSDLGLGNLIVTAISGFCIALIILGLKRKTLNK